MQNLQPFLTLLEISTLLIILLSALSMGGIEKIYGEATNCTVGAINCTAANAPTNGTANHAGSSTNNGTATNTGTSSNNGTAAHTGGSSSNGTATSIGKGGSGTANHTSGGASNGTTTNNGTVANSGDSFDVTKYGALGDGLTDDFKAFMGAWKAICAKFGDPKLIIPKGIYLLSPLSFDGPCNCNLITIEVLGEIVAPGMTWSVTNVDTWISFRHVNGLVVHGNGTGTINGRGSVWWQNAKDDTSRPTALRFSDCQNLVVDGLNHVDSQRNHISITECDGATLSNLMIKAPPTSPNTDGIDIANSKNIQIRNLRISTGDDCIAINGGSFGINITNVACGPGHGISIGSLGKDGKHEIVEQVHVSNCRFIHTENGVRIKTWQGGSGFAKGISFKGITLEEANNPIIINQYYCPRGACGNEESAVEVSDVTYSEFVGTSISTEAISFNCSKIAPCSNILLDNINITYAYGYSPTYAHCVNALGIIAHSISSNLSCPTH